MGCPESRRGAGRSGSRAPTSTPAWVRQSTTRAPSRVSSARVIWVRGTVSPLPLQCTAPVGSRWVTSPTSGPRTMAKPRRTHPAAPFPASGLAPSRAAGARASPAAMTRLSVHGSAAPVIVHSTAATGARAVDARVSCEATFYIVTRGELGASDFATTGLMTCQPAGRGVRGQHYLYFRGGPAGAQSGDSRADETVRPSGTRARPSRSITGTRESSSVAGSPPRAPVG